MAFDITPEEFNLYDLLEACVERKLRVKAQIIDGAKIIDLHEVALEMIEGDMVLANDNTFGPSEYYTFGEIQPWDIVKKTGKKTYHEVTLTEDATGQLKRFALSFYRVTIDHIC